MSQHHTCQSVSNSFTMHTNDNGTFYFHDGPEGGRMSVKGTARQTCPPCMMLPLLFTTLHGSGQPKNPQHLYKSTPVWVHVAKIESFLYDRRKTGLYELKLLFWLLTATCVLSSSQDELDFPSMNLLDSTTASGLTPGPPRQHTAASQKPTSETLPTEHARRPAAEGTSSTRRM